MKKKLFFTLTFLWCALLSFGQTFTSNGLNYSITSATTAEVAANSGLNGSYNILPTVNYNGTDYTVTAIGYQAFYQNIDLTAITIPNTITNIGLIAFYGCSGLTSVVLPNSVVSMEEGVFIDCSSLISVTLPNSLTSISDRTFKYCTNLTFISIPNSVTSIGVEVFTQSGLSSVTIPDSVTSLGNNAFSHCLNLTSITIPDTVTSVGEYLLANCTQLTSAVISNSITTLPDNIFYECSNLSSFNIPSNITKIGGRAFQNCTGLTSILIPETITNISYEAFSGCTGLTTINIPSSVSVISELAFAYCTNLNSVYVNWIQPIGIYNNVFYNITLSQVSLYVPQGTYFNYQQPYSIWPSFGQIIDPCGIPTFNTTTVSICDSYTWGNNGQTYTSSGIYTGTTTNCVIEKLDLTISNQYGFEFDGIYYYATSSTTAAAGGYSTASGAVIIPTNVSDVCGTYTVTSIDSYAFSDFSDLTSISIPNSVTSIGDNAFSDSTNLTSITIPDSVTSIGESVFDSCTGLISVTIPNSVISIGESAFYDCSGLTSINIPNSVTSIGYSAFSRCTGLTTVSIPNSVTSIDDYAFFGCTNLSSVTVGWFNPLAITPEVFFEMMLNNITLYVPSGSISEYESAAVWQDFSPITPGCSNLTNNTTITSACESYTWANNGQTYTTSGFYAGSTANCVTEMLDLTLTPSSVNTTTASACDSYTWANNGQTYTINGVYIGLTANCVTEKLDLTITPSSVNTTTITACNNYTWNGTAYTTSGVYSGLTTNCITEKLDLTITPISENTTITSACESYTWANNGQTYTTSGVYAGSVTNCVTEMLNLTINNSITPTFSQIASVCSGTTLSALSETSNNFVSGTWSPALNNLATTTYTFTPNSGQCANTTTLTIAVNTLDSTLSLDNGTISSNQPDGNFQWVNCANNNEPISGEISQSFTPAINGQYAVNIELDNCTITSECINIDFLKVEDFNSFSKIIIFPNPAIFELNIKTDYKIVDIKIIDILGKVSDISNFANNKINVSNLSEGMYFLEIKTENGLFKEKFIKK